MNQMITIQRRSIKPESISNVGYNEEFENVASVWAAVNTNRSYRSFNRVGVNQASGTGAGLDFTHKFYIQYSPECVPTTENVVEWQCNKYKILGVENLDASNRFLALSCVLKGPSELKANLA